MDKIKTYTVLDDGLTAREVNQYSKYAKIMRIGHEATAKTCPLTKWCEPASAVRGTEVWQFLCYWDAINSEWVNSSDHDSDIVMRFETRIAIEPIEETPTAKPISEKVEVDNILIADFMGWVHHKDQDYDRSEMGNLKYKTSWDWLMPVVEKIEKEDHVYFDIYNEATKVRYQPQEITKWYKMIYDSEVKINHVYNAVIEFIKWYNEFYLLPPKH